MKSQNGGFDGDNIDAMFAAAAGASEDTGEKDLVAYNENPKKSNESVKTEVAKQEPVKKQEEPVKHKKNSYQDTSK